ncbi:Hpr(Ser) kinase/phosphatase [Pararhodospirillum photometricum DSM 122]|uniref:Hpr(Ser) kinase/phosphatase n=2 Tax=Pararhodospirillum photometricum TaxID=1084 RepID=H6SNN9_PARPM|nr:Hpr(Ser) kinase/phosphatase [Pararhodospirillum photometricum DSM 122]
MVPGSPPWSQGTRTSAQARRIRHAPAPSSFPSPNETGFDPQPALGHSARMSLTSSLPTTLHATALEKGGVAILLRGPSGAGKSDLALRLLDRGFRLIADDRVVPHVEEAGLRVSAPSALAGLLEVRGVGIVSVPAVGGSVPLALVVDLVPGGPVERLPDPAWAVIENTPVPLVRCDPWELSAPHKVDLALALRREESPLSYLSHTPSY